MRSDNVWPQTPLGDVVELLTSGISRPFYSEQKGVPVLRSNNVRDGKIDTGDLKYWHDPDPRGANLEDVRPQPGDILINFVNGSMTELGKAAMYAGEPSRCIISTNFYLVRFNRDRIRPAFALQYFGTAAYRRWLRSVVGATGQGCFNQVQLRRMHLPEPPPHVQDGIVSAAKLWDNAITATARLLKLKHRLKRGLMQQLLTGRRRFPEFVGQPAWSRTPLSKFLAEKSETNADGAVSEVLSCTKKGIVRQMERFGKRLASTKVSHYQVVRRGDLVYDPMLLWDASMGFVRCVDVGIVSPAYATLSFAGNEDDRAFLDLLLTTHTMRHFYKVISQGTNARRRKALPADFLKLAPLMPPTEAEEKRVTQFFGLIDNEINLLEGQLAALREQKKGLIQKLLTGEVRLPEFSGERLAP